MTLGGLGGDGELAQHLHAEPGPGSVPLRERSMGCCGSHWSGRLVQSLEGQA